MDNNSVALTVLAVLGSLPILIVLMTLPKSHEWRKTTAWRKRPLLDGGSDDGDLMKRRTPDGRWEYRRMTALEKERHIDPFWD